MAEALLRSKVPASSDTVIGSAGIAALVGEPADPEAIRLMQERDLDITDHRARQANPELVMNADLIMVMEQAHVQPLYSISPSTRGKVHTLGKWDGMEIPDPYRKSPEYFEYVLGLIEQGVDAWSAKLWR
ncbi:MAG TPA: low molecular weight protein-tyrosine-phosphatase [Mariprofundaceae bacterium]|nr:low molecular weight protein-tyrosine-phosphatase [Mariprofundaceae bacterium]